MGRCLIPPAIDPLSHKNQIPAEDGRGEILGGYGVDRGGPSSSRSRVSTPGRTPWGSCETYPWSGEEYAGRSSSCRLHGGATTPRAGTTTQKVEKTGDDPDIHLLSNLQGVGNLEVNAFQRRRHGGAAEVAARGVRAHRHRGHVEGQAGGGGTVGGILLQIDDGVDGFLVDDFRECADCVKELLADPARRERVGENARRKVLGRFLSTRHVGDYLDLFHALQ